jgi:hypothetical protein
MEAVEALSMDGHIQKNYAIMIINELISALPESNEKQFLLNMSKQGNIDNIIELVIDASKGRININKIVSNVIEEVLEDESENSTTNKKNKTCGLIFSCIFSFITYLKGYKKVNINGDQQDQAQAVQQAHQAVQQAHQAVQQAHQSVQQAHQAQAQQLVQKVQIVDI